MISGNIMYDVWQHRDNMEGNKGHNVEGDVRVNVGHFTYMPCLIGVIHIMWFKGHSTWDNKGDIGDMISFFWWSCEAENFSEDCKQFPEVRRGFESYLPDPSPPPQVTVTTYSSAQWQFILFLKVSSYSSRAITDREKSEKSVIVTQK